MVGGSMFNLKEANVNEELVIRDIVGTDEQMLYMEYLGMTKGSTLIVIGEGALPNTLLVKVKDIIYQLNPDLIRRIMVDVKGKTKIKE